MKTLKCASKLTRQIQDKPADEKFIFTSLDEVRLALDDIEFDQRFTSRIKHAGTVQEDGTFMLSKKEVENVLRKEFDFELPAHILQATRAQLLGSICELFGYGYDEANSYATPKLKATSADSSDQVDMKANKLVFSKIGDPTAPVIESSIFPNEFYTRAENSPQPFELRCLRHIACIAWARATWQQRAESLLETDTSAVQEIGFSEYEDRVPAASALWMMKILSENKYDEFMNAVGYDRSIIRVPGREHFEIRSNAFSDCEWVFGNFNHKNPIIISSDVYNKSVSMTQFIVLMTAWRRLVPTKNALQMVLTKIGYKPIR